MIYALIRYLLFEIPSAFLRGLAFILFEKDEITGAVFTCRKIKKPINKQAIITKYLERCRKQVQQQEDKNEEKGKKEK